MIRTYIIPCDLPKTAADTLNRASGTVYTRTLVTHYRVYRKRGKRTRHWLSQFAGMRLNDYLSRDDPLVLHAHSKDAAQEGFYKACKTAQANRDKGTKYPHKRKFYRTTIWKSTGIRRQGDRLLLSQAKGLPPIIVELPEHLRDVLRVLEVRLVYDHYAHRYTWHLVVENGRTLRKWRLERTLFRSIWAKFIPRLWAMSSRPRSSPVASGGTSSKVTPNGSRN